MNKGVSKNRLLKLADFLRKLPSKRFNYCVWVALNWVGKLDVSCDTTACALGWATAMPEFRRLGLYLNRTRQVSLRGYRVVDRRAIQPSVYAAAKLFGISVNQAMYLFVPDCNELGFRASAKDVAKHIERFARSL